MTTLAAGFDLSREQSAAVDRCVKVARTGDGAFIFVTGAAGTGKSTILRELRDRLKLLVCAPTGIAAINVGGSTIHGLFRFGIGPKTRRMVKGDPSKRDLFARADAIVIDEISMVRADLLDQINVFLQKTLGNDWAFGGKTIIAFGDMWQLEPVVGDGEVDFIRENYESPFWFDAHVLKAEGKTNLLEKMDAVRVETIELQEVFRQQGDTGFLDALNKIRVGDPSGIAYFNDRVTHEQTDAIAITFTNARAETINRDRLEKLPFESLTFSAEYEGEIKENEKPVPAELHLRVGAQVMFAKNIQGGTGYIANGSVGVVCGFHKGLPLVEVNGGVERVDREEWKKIGYTYDRADDNVSEKTEGVYRQIPLKLAWAITAHKSQGQTLDAACLELEKPAQTHGQLYVALSRVRTIGGLQLRRRLSPADINVNPRVRQFLTGPLINPGVFD